MGSKKEKQYYDLREKEVAGSHEGGQTWGGKGEVIKKNYLKRWKKNNTVTI